MQFVSTTRRTTMAGQASRRTVVVQASKAHIGAAVAAASLLMVQPGFASLDAKLSESASYEAELQSILKSRGKLLPEAPAEAPEVKAPAAAAAIVAVEEAVPVARQTIREVELKESQELVLAQAAVSTDKQESARAVKAATAALQASRSSSAVASADSGSANNNIILLGVLAVGAVAAAALGNKGEGADGAAPAAVEAAAPPAPPAAPPASTSADGSPASPSA